MSVSTRAEKTGRPAGSSGHAVLRRQVTTAATANPDDVRSVSRRTRDVEALAQLGAAAGGVDGEADQVQQERHRHLDRHAVQATALLCVLCAGTSMYK